GRAGVGAEGVAEIDQHQLAAEIPRMPCDGILVGEREFAADRDRRHLLALQAAREECAEIVGKHAQPHDEAEEKRDQPPPGGARHGHLVRYDRGSAAAGGAWVPSGSGSSGRPSAAPIQSSPARSRTTGPTATTAGGSSPCAAASAAARARV